VLQLDQQEQERQSQPRILPPLLEKLAMFSIAQIKWITKVWLVFSWDLQLQDHGVVSMSSTDLCQRCFPFAQFNSKQYVMVLNKRKIDAQSKNKK